MAGTAHIFHGLTSVTYCNAFQCVAPDGIFAGGALANNTTVDPLHVNLYTDLRLLPGSPLIRAGTTGNPDLDYNGNDFQTPATIGAYESIVTASATATDAETIAVVLTGSYVEADVEDPASWTLTAAGGLEVTPIFVVYSGGTATITTWPAMSPGIEYSVTASWSGYGYDLATFTPSSAFSTGATVDDYRNVAAAANSLGRQLLDAGGVAETVLASELAVDATTALVDSTLGFPDEGAFWLAARRFTYTSKTDAAFHGLAEAVPRVEAIGAGGSIVLDEASYIPPA